MKIQKKIAMTFGGAVLAACVTVGGLAAANAATPSAGSATTASATSAGTQAGTNQTAATSPATSTQAADTVPVPTPPDTPYNFDDWIKTLSPAQQQALLVDQEAKLAKYQQAGLSAVADKFSYNVSALKKALGQ